MAVTDLVDVVDEDDKVIGKALIQEVRSKGLIHRIARVMVENPQGQILLQKRTQKLLWPNCWDNSAAGHVDAGEDYITAARRELFEEIGIENAELKEVGNYFTDVVVGPDILKRFNQLYKVVIDFTPTNLEESEVSEVKWFDIEDVKKLMQEHPEQVTDGLVDVMEKFYK